jgi:hypothetical protein
MHGVGCCSASFRFADQQMNVLGHDHVSVNVHLELAAHALQANGKQVLDRCGREERMPVRTGEGQEMRLAPEWW